MTDVVETVVETAAGVVANDLGRPEIANEQSPARLNVSIMGTDSIVRGTLGNGLRVVTEEMPSLRSVAVGLWIGTGGIDEPEKVLGASHFLEHLGFKGTSRRSAIEIAQEIESIGGDMNAFTAHELTCFYVRVPDVHLELAIDMLTDVVWSPTLDAADVDQEREVILEEIRMRDDQPDDVVHETFMEAMFAGHPLSRSVLGTPESVAAMTRDDIANYHAAHYVPSNTVIAVAGNATHEQVTALVEARHPDTGASRPKREAPSIDPVRPLIVTRRPSEQAHVVLGHRSFAREDPDRYALAVLNQALGGGMASRLFQEVREKRGLAYSVYSFRSAYADVGAMAVYVGTGPEKVHETLSVVRDVLSEVIENGLTDAEVASSKGHLTGATALALESSSSRMQRIGRGELIEKTIPTLDDLTAYVAAVTPDDVRRVARRMFEGPEVLAVAGPFDESDFSGQAI